MNREAKLDELKDWQKYMVIIFDEMKLKEGLVYDKFTDSITGFTDLGDTNKFINECEVDGQTRCRYFHVSIDG